MLRLSLTFSTSSFVDQFPQPKHRSYLFAFLFIALLETLKNGGLCLSWRHFFLTSLLKRKILSLSSRGNLGFAKCMQQRKLKSKECISSSLGSAGKRPVLYFTGWKWVKWFWLVLLPSSLYNFSCGFEMNNCDKF